MKVLVLGSEGFIGKHCVLHYLKSGHEVLGCDLLDLKEPEYPYFKISRISPGFEELFENNQFDVCINAAGSGSVPLSFTHAFGDFEANTIDVFRLLGNIKHYSPNCRYINLSSAAVYGNPAKLPISEEESLKPMSPYGWHKYYSELICKEYHTLYGIATCSIRPFSVYGPGLKKQLFWDIYHKTHGTKEVTLFGTGNESRDFIYIDDLIKVIALLGEIAPMQGEAYNAASGVETTISDAAQCLISNIDKEIILKFNGTTKAGDPLNWRADISRISELGFSPSTGLETGLQNYTQWLTEKK